MNSVWHRYINTNFRHHPVLIYRCQTEFTIRLIRLICEALQIDQMANSGWYRYINIDFRQMQKVLQLEIYNNKNELTLCPISRALMTKPMPTVTCNKIKLILKAN